MGLFDKIKNALFEEEYVEVEEKPKKVKKEVSKVSEERPIAKKVVLPERDIRAEELDEDVLVDEDFDVKQKAIVEEPVPEKKDFKVMDDDDFKVDEYRLNEPQIVKVLDDDAEISTSREEPLYYQGKRDRNNYGYGDVSRVTVPEYGRSNYETTQTYSGIYQKKEDSTHFKPSPIISPIYGILDKNYKKEDVVTKREVRLTSSYARENISVEDVRKKAYGNLSDDIEKELDIAVAQKNNANKDDENLLVDLSDEEDKPTVKEVTMGDALEYFEDLGLEYNVDYVDANKENTVGRRSKDNYDEILDTKSEELEEDNKEVMTSREEVKKTDDFVTKADNSSGDEDNLFDLIDSMYKDND